jgi:hypothetical protein
MVESTKVEDKIVYIQNVIKDPETLERLINSTTGSAIPDWSVWMAYQNPDVVWGKAKNIFHSLLSEEKDSEAFKNQEYIITTLKQGLSDAFEEYTRVCNLDSKISEHFSNVIVKPDRTIGVNIYFNNCTMGPHIDYNEAQSADLSYSIVLYINDDYDGGELHFRKFDLSVKPSAGSAIVFPSSAPYYHESIPTTRGDKMMLTYRVEKRDESLESR